MRSKAAISIWALLFLLCTEASAHADQRYRNLGNPTQFTFSTSEQRVIDALNALSGTKIGELLAAGPVNEGFRLFLDPTYTKSYWVGREERKEEVDPREAGTIGTIKADFDVAVVSSAPDKTLVKITVRSFEQQVGRHCVMFPHFHKTGKRVPVKSDTYYEYLFLRKLGESLGEKNMPPLVSGKH